MQELISRVAQNVGIEESLAKPAIGVVMNMLNSVLPEGTASSVMNALPGTESLLSEANQAGSGGIGGMLGGALSSVTGGSAGAVTKAISQMQSLGLSTDQAKGVASEVVNFAKENVPADVAATMNEKLPNSLT